MRKHLHNFILTHDSVNVMNDKADKVEADTNKNEPVIHSSEWGDHIAEAI
jgi:hypothetical protein